MGRIIVEGKTKIIEEDVGGKVRVVSKPVFSKGDGKVRLTLEGKDRWANRTTCNVFKLLAKQNIPSAFWEQIDEVSFSAYEADMVPIEVVVRFIAFGSRLKRHPEEKEGTFYEWPVVEFFYKDDEEGDPFLIFDLISRKWLMLDAKKPPKEGFIREMPQIKTKKGRIIDHETIIEMVDIAEKVSFILRDEWEKLKVLLVDLKMEFGFIFKHGKIILVLADVLDNDSWRIWLMGDKIQMKDKEVFRLLKEVTPEDRNKLKENYQWVAEATEKFLA